MRPLISDATMFAAQRGRTRDRHIPIRSTWTPARLPSPTEFDPRDQKATRYGWIIVAVCGAVIVLGKLAGVL